MHTHRYLLLGIAAVMLTSYAWPGPSQEFTAASVKLSVSKGDGAWGSPPIPTEPIATLDLPHATLQGLLSQAYSLRMFQISGPSWIESAYYDVTAKVPKGASRLQIAEMLRKLLSERFQMKVRLDSRESNGWALVVGKPPLKLTPTSLPGEPTIDYPDGVPGRWSSMEFGSRSRRDVHHGESMHGLALTLWGQTGEPVQDLTGLRGAYDFALQLEGVERMASPSSASVKTALREWGLDLVKQRVQTQHLIVESATKTPIPN